MAFKSLLPGISLRAYAMHRGCSRQSVHQAVKAGRLLQSVRRFDGVPRVIDPDVADREWMVKRRIGRPRTKRLPPLQRTCRTCNVQVGRKRLYCAGCLAVRRRQQDIASNERIKSARVRMRTCKACPSKISTSRQFCSSCYAERRKQQALARASVPKTCAHCGQQFRGRASASARHDQRYCSPRCAGHSGPKKARSIVPCPRCGREFWPWSGGRHPRKFCSRGCIAKPKAPSGPRPRPCKWCATPFAVLYKRYCSDECRRRAASQRKHLRRRGQRRKQELIPLEEIYKRDRGICGLCHRRVSLKFKPNDPRSATLDHIIPVHPSKGGTHTRENVQLAHYGCNSSKRDRIRGQLRLL